MRAINNKRGEKLYAFIWIISFLVVGAVVVYSTFKFFSAPIDSRDFHTKILYEKISDCLQDSGFLRSEIFETDFNIETFCKLNNSVMFTDNLFYYEINITEKKDNSEKLFLKGGSGKLKGDCIVSSNNKADYFPSCYSRKNPVFYLDNFEQKKEAYVEIFTSSNNLGKRLGINEKND